MNQTNDANPTMLIEHQNPLLLKVIAYLRKQTTPISEHELMTHLAADFAAVITLSESPNLALFQKHFLLMNALYQLQVKLWHSGEHLYISALEICIRPRPKTDQDWPALNENSLRDYYLDWRNLSGTTDEDVANLISTFWQRYRTHVDATDAWEILGLEPGTNWKTIKDTYRRLIADKHPDRGGKSGDFILLREAYEVLRKAYSQ